MAEVFVSFAIDGDIHAYAKAHELLAHHGFRNQMHRNGLLVALPPTLMGRSIDGQNLPTTVHDAVANLLISNNVRLTHLTVMEVTGVAVADRFGRVALRNDAAPDALGVTGTTTRAATAGERYGALDVLAFVAAGDDAPFPWGAKD